MEEEFYPNECFVCKSTKDLRQCNRCQMVSYCGEDHQKEHWNIHKGFCKIISEHLKSLKVSHLYEKLRGATREKWIEERFKTRKLLQAKFSRPLLLHEIQMFYFPRTCFVCHEAKQQILSNCPDCPSVSFCPQHKDLRRHAKDCFITRESRNLSDIPNITEEMKVILTTTSLVDRIMFLPGKAQNPPKSMKQLLIHYPKPPVEVEEKYKTLSSEHLTPALTLYNALQKLKLLSKPLITVHVNAMETFPHINVKSWEIVLHLMPNLKLLRIIVTNFKQTQMEDLKLCDDCIQNKREVPILFLSVTYEKYMTSRLYEPPDIFLFYDSCIPLAASTIMPSYKIQLPLSACTLSCPIVLLSYKEIQDPQKGTKKAFPKHVVHYSGSNEFATLKSRRDCETQEMYRINSHMMILSPESAVSSQNEKETIRDSVKPTRFQENGIQEKIDQKVKNNDSAQKKSEKVKKMDEKKLEQNKIEQNKSSQNIKEKKPEVSKSGPNQNKVGEKESEESKHQNKIEKKSLDKRIINEKTAEQNQKETSSSAETNKSDLDGNKVEENCEDEEKILCGEIDKSYDYYEFNSCQVCHISIRCSPCSRCKMISYCGDEHRKEHWPEHKNLCKVILGMLKESEGTTLFDKCKTSDMDSWLKIKINFVLKAQSKLGRKLLDYEKQVFLFPRACFVCHETDLSVLKPCYCGIILCRQHKKSSKHEKFCNDYRLIFSLSGVLQIVRTIPFPKLFINDLTGVFIKTIPMHKKSRKLPNSIVTFMNTYLQISEEDRGAVGKYRKELISEYFSRPLTALYVLEKLNLTSDSSLNIHIFGATKEEAVFSDYWEILFHWFPDLKVMEIWFIGPELEETSSSEISICNSCENLEKKPVLVHQYRGRYDEFLKETSSPKPDIIFGFNLDLHEIEYGMTECTWKETLVALKSLKAPFVMTSGTDKRAKKDHQRFRALVEKSATPEIYQENPFASLLVERDFETEELKYPNKFIIAYRKLYEKPKVIEKEETPEEKKVELELKVDLEEKKSENESSKEVPNLEIEKNVPEEDIKKLEVKSKTQDEEKIAENLKIEKIDEVLKTSNSKEIQNQKDDPKVVKSSQDEKTELKEVRAEKVEKENKVLESVKKEEKSTVNTAKRTEAMKVDQKTSKIECNGKIESGESKVNIEKEKSKTDSLKTEIVESKDRAKMQVITNSVKTTEDILSDSELVKQNELLKEENEKLKSENVVLRSEIERLKSENKLIMDLRSQIKEGIRLAMDENK